MNRKDEYSNPHIPPSTPPAIDPAADPVSARELSGDRGDSDAEGAAMSSFDRSAEDDAIIADHNGGGGGDTDEPGKTPPEVEPDEGDTTNPTAPDEIEIERPDTIEPGRGPLETPPPPD